MAANEHKNLTDVNRHNPKGFESANNDTVLSKSTGTGTANTDGSLVWLEKSELKIDNYNIQGYVTTSNANYYYGANMTDGQSPNEYNQGFGSSDIGNQTIDGGDFFKVSSLTMTNACSLRKIFLSGNCTTGAVVTIAICKLSLSNTSAPDAITPLLLNEVTYTGLSSLDKVIKIANLAPESSMTRGDLLFAMIKTSTAATAFFKLGIEVGYDN
jgi:hypothetical protein|tara:strand:+ start:784 stop:1422 length:639 start_codon:yes stop_codon:yes gene_type:complete